MLLTNSSSFYRLDELFVQLVWRACLQQLAARPDQCAEVRRITWQSPRQQRYVNRDLEPTELCVNLSDPRAHRGERKDPRAAADEGGPQCTVVHVRTVTSAPGGRAAGASATNAAGPGGGGGGPAAAERRALTRVY